MACLRRTAVPIVAILILALAWLLHAQNPPAGTFTIVSRDGRRPLATTATGGQDMVGLDDVAAAFSLMVREDALAGGFTMALRGRTLVAAVNQPTVSVNGKVILLPAPVQHVGRRWLVPIEFLQLAIAPLSDQRIQVRRPSRLVIVGDLRVPRVSARIDGTGAASRVVFDITPATPVSVTTDGSRTTIKLDADALDLTLPPEGAAPIEQLRPGDQPNTIAVQAAAGSGPFRATPQTADPVTRLTLDLQPQSAAQTPATPAATPPPADANAGRPTPPPAQGPPVSVESLTARNAPPTVILDPGHGGDDVGAKSAGGLQEKQLTLDIARRVKTMIEMRLGLRVLLTRDGDTALPLEARVAFANNHTGDLFLSLHANAAPSPTVEGAQIYYLQPDREGERARAEATKTAVAIPILGGGTRTLDLIPWQQAQARHIEASVAFAEALATALSTRSGGSAPPVRQAPLRVLEGVNMPAVLVEVAFLSSPSQVKVVASDEFKTMTAQGLVEGLAAFRRPRETPSR
jgi:N-acetylmuramoyl-L-alanine amidase